MLQMGFLCSGSARAPKVFLNRWNKPVLRPKIQPPGLHITMDWPFNFTQQPNHHLTDSKGAEDWFPSSCIPWKEGSINTQRQQTMPQLLQSYTRMVSSARSKWKTVPFCYCSQKWGKVRKERRVTKLYYNPICNHKIAKLTCQFKSTSPWKHHCKSILAKSHHCRRNLLMTWSRILKQNAAHGKQFVLHS